jgi:membrane associated rhomboid family serine protease
VAPTEAKACPRCGALIVPQQERCRRCNAYLHGTWLEALIFEHLLLGAENRGTALLCLAISLSYLGMAAAAGPSSAIAFSRFSLEQLGATHGPSILRGEYWRFATSIFAHHDLLHIALNLWSLVAVGPLVEQIFDKKKMMLIYLAAGVLSMVVSHVWYAYARGDVPYVSAGASGAVCGMIGAAWVGARRLGPDGAETAKRMKRWALYMIAWGFLAPGINNAAHAGGFAFGALFAAITPPRITQTVAGQRVLSFALLLALAGVVASEGLMLRHLRGFPAVLERDATPRFFLGQVVAEGVEPAQSDQADIWSQCDDEKPARERLHACELNVRVNDRPPESYLRLAALLGQTGGDPDDIAALRDIAHRLARSWPHR